MSSSPLADDRASFEAWSDYREQAQTQLLSYSCSPSDGHGRVWQEQWARRLNGNNKITFAISMIIPIVLHRVGFKTRKSLIVTCAWGEIIGDGMDAYRPRLHLRHGSHLQVRLRTAYLHSHRAHR